MGASKSNIEVGFRSGRRQAGAPNICYFISDEPYSILLLATPEACATARLFISILLVARPFDMKCNGN